MRILLFILFISNCLISQEIQLGGVDNLYKVNAILYRSGQPDAKGFGKLDSLGISTVISLRNRVSDKKRAKRNILTLYRIRINTWRMDSQDIIEALQLIKNADHPVLIHCLHGSDRTGVIVASYRMIFEDWPKQKAIDEFLLSKYGYHERWFPGLLDLLKDLNVEQIKEDLGQL